MNAQPLPIDARRQRHRRSGGAFGALRRHPFATAYVTLLLVVVSAAGLVWGAWVGPSLNIRAQVSAASIGSSQSGLASLEADYTRASPARTAAITISNTGSTRSPFTFSFSGSAPDTGTAFTSTTWASASAAACTGFAIAPADAVSTASAVPAALTGVLDPATSAVYCVREQLSSAASAQVYGATLTLSGTLVGGSGAWAQASTTTALLHPVDNVAPSVATVSVSQVLPTVAQLAWPSSSDDVQLAGYRVFRDNTVVATLTPDATTWADDSLVPDTTYAFRVDAYDGSGNVQTGNTVSPKTTPATYVRFTATNSSSRCLDVWGGATTSGTRVALYTCGTQTNQGWGIAPLADGSVRIYPKHATSLRLATTGSAAGSTTITYSPSDAANDRWNVSTNADATVSLYNVAAGLCLAADTDAGNGTDARLQTCNAASAGQKFAYTSFATDVTAPVAPTVAVSGTTGNSATLAWSGASDDVAVTSYEIKRAGTVVATLGPLVSSWTDTSLNGHTTYSYTVGAVDAAGNKTPSTATTATTTAPSPGGSYVISTSDSALCLSSTGTTSGTAVSATTCKDSNDQVWVASYLSDGTVQFTPKLATGLRLGAPSNAAGTQLQSLTSPGKNARWIPVGQSDGTFSLTSADTGLCVGMAGTTSGTAVQAQSCASQTFTLRAISVTDTVPPSTPVPALAVTPTTATLTWPAATDNSAITGYNIYRGGTLVTKVAWNARTWTDDSLVPTTAYSYQVEALDAGGQASKSSSVSATTLVATYSRFTSATNNNRCFNVSGSSKTSGTKVVLSDCVSTTDSQGWGIAPLNDGSVRIFPKHITTMRLGATSAAAGTAVSMLSSATAANDRWNVRTNADGTVSLYNVASGLCLAADAGTANNGALRIQTCNATSAYQKFTQKGF